MRSYDEFSSRVQHLLADHRRLHVMLQITRAALLHGGGPRHDATFSDVVRVLQQIRDELAHHFAEEETSGCLEEARSRCPRLSAQAERVRAEHPDILRNIERLIAQALDGEQTVEDRIAIEKAFDELCEQLYAHEAAENDLLRQGFASELGDETHVSTAALNS
jgi:hemerythrin